MKKIFAIVLVVMALLNVSVFADGAVIEKTEYEGMGVVEVDFAYDVQYDNLAVTVQDQNGLDYEVTIWERDDDDLLFKVTGILPDLEYTYAITGVRYGASGSFGAVSGTFSVPANEGTAIRQVEYDAEDREIEVEFFGRVNLRDAEAVITDYDGNEYEVKLREKEYDGFDARVSGLRRGERYTIKVTGTFDGETTETAIFNFVAWDD